MELTIGGPIGSGKSTVARMLSASLKTKYVSTGDIFRESAKEHGMSVEEFNVYAEAHHEIDIELDNRLLETMQNGDNMVIDSRLAGWLSYKRGIQAFRIFVTADLAVRVERIMQREGISRDIARERLIFRETSERRRYQAIYQIDIADTSIYDISLDTGKLSPHQAVSEIVKKLTVDW